jgi:predicted nucleic acid-binding protein
MAGTSAAEITDAPGPGLYVDASALAKLYLPEPESDELDRFLLGRIDLVLSELSITEVVSAVARRRREGALTQAQANRIRDAVLADAGGGAFRRLDLSPATHRRAEQLLLSAGTVPLRTLDALHIALALSGDAMSIVTFDVRMEEAAMLHGLRVQRPA